MVTVETVQVAPFRVSYPGWYVLCISASCSSGSHMRIEIDNLVFREIPPVKNAQLYTVPAAWNGNLLRGKKQTNYYVLHFEQGEHQLRYFIRGSISDVNLSLTHVNNVDKLHFTVDAQADNRNWQPFINFILVDLPLASVGGDVSLRWHRVEKLRGDGDDVRVLVDGKTYTINSNLSLWSAIPTVEQIEVRQHRVVCPTLDTNLHYVELRVDRSPLIHTVEICTRPVYRGDYWLQVTRREIPDGSGGMVNKPMLGVYIPSGNPMEINNSDFELRYKMRSFALGADDIDTHLPEMVDNMVENVAQKVLTKFNLESQIDQEGNWFFYGIDSSWRIKKEAILDLDWQDIDNWELIRKK